MVLDGRGGRRVVYRWMRGATPDRKGQEQRSGLPMPRVIDACLPVVKHAIRGPRIVALSLGHA